MSVLDQLIDITPVQRETYGNDMTTKPNNHCNLVDRGINFEDLVWEENDEHFRNRLKVLVGEK